jgi:hypothetical protein
MPSSCSETPNSVSCAAAPGGQLQQCLASSSPNAACGELFFDLNLDPDEQTALDLSSLTSAQSTALAALQAALVSHVGAGNWPPECN